VARGRDFNIKVRGQWVYLYRAVHKEGCTVDFLLSRRRGGACNEAAWNSRVITLDGYAASHRAVAKLKTSGILPLRVRVRSSRRAQPEEPVALDFGARAQDFL
jgi:transposase-like protein